jgi:hypothetical protein
MMIIVLEEHLKLLHPLLLSTLATRSVVFKSAAAASILHLGLIVFLIV